MAVLRIGLGLLLVLDPGALLRTRSQDQEYVQRCNLTSRLIPHLWLMRTAIYRSYAKRLSARGEGPLLGQSAFGVHCT